MKKFSLILTFLLGMYSTNLTAQYIIDPELPVPTPRAASDITEYGFNANWNPVSNVAGYLVKTFVTCKAETNGETFDYINTDFSFIVSDYTTDNPDDNGTTQGEIKMDVLKVTNRCGWRTMNAVYANGVLGLNNAWYHAIVNGSLVSPILDLRNGDGKVKVKFKIKGDNRAKSLIVQIRNTDVIPNVAINSHTVPVTTEWVEHEFTLEGGIEHCDIYFEGCDAGNGEALYYFFDDLRVWQELKSGEEGTAIYSDANFANNPVADNLYITTTELGPKEKYAFSVASYKDGKVSYDSQRVHLDEDPSGIECLTQDKGIYIEGGILHLEGVMLHVKVYNATGMLVGEGTGNITLPGRGIYIVKIGNKTYRVLNTN